jgi:hypothetical protein
MLLLSCLDVSNGFLTKKEARLYLNRIDQNIEKAHEGRPNAPSLVHNTTPFSIKADRNDAESPSPGTEDSE